MYTTKLTLFCAVGTCVLASCLAIFDPITLTIGSTAFVASSSQVAIGAASIAGLAIVKEALILADISRNGRRGRRDVDNTVVQSPVNFESLFDAIAESDIADCGKLLVCHSMAKNEHALTREERLVTQLFDDLEVINPNTGYAEYQLAAYVGTFKQPEVCLSRYARCPIPATKLGDLIKVDV